jgi:5-methylcytosine-specific restriction endonuclease McrA
METKKFMARANSYAWKKLRLVVLARDSYACAYCGKDATEVDHIVPVKHDPTLALDIENLQATCRTCNRQKGTKSRPMPKVAKNAVEARFFIDTNPHPPAGGILSPMKRIDP